jgi:hypothetical protein
MNSLTVGVGHDAGNPRTAWTEDALRAAGAARVRKRGPVGERRLRTRLEDCGVTEFARQGKGGKPRVWRRCGGWIELSSCC